VPFSRCPFSSIPQHSQVPATIEGIHPINLALYCTHVAQTALFTHVPGGIRSSKVTYSSSLRTIFLNLSRRFATISAESCCYSSAWPRTCTFPVRILAPEYIMECSLEAPRPGVQWLQDPRSKVYSFSTWLEQIIPVQNFAFERLQSFVPSSRDKVRHTHFTKFTVNTTHLGSLYHRKT